MALHFITLIFSICSFVLLLIANLGTTFNSTFLPEIYLVKINQAVTGRSIRYGVYNSCLYYEAGGKTLTSCTAKMPGYKFDATQFAVACGADVKDTATVNGFLDVVSKTNMGTFQGIVLIMPAAVLAFVALFCTLLIRRIRSSNVIPFVGAFGSLLSFFTGAAGLALAIVTFWKGLETLEERIEGLSHQWGPAIYLVGIGSGCIVISLVCFVISLFSYKSESYKRETFNLYDYDLNNTNHNGANSNSYDHYSSHLNSPSKHDSYGYAVTSPTTNNYPSYHQPQTYPQQGGYQQQQSGYY